MHSCNVIKYTILHHTTQHYSTIVCTWSNDDMTHPLALMSTAIASMAVLKVSTPISLSRVIVVITYIGGAISLILTGASATLLLSPSNSASLIASMPSYVKQVTSMSALILTGWGASLLLTYVTTAFLVSSSTSRPSKISSSVSLQ